MSGNINTVFQKLIKKYGIQYEVRQNEALFLWEKVVGDSIAKHAKAEKISFGKLYVKVDSPVWRNELIFQKHEILNKINKELKNANINDIVLR
jgi:predicted nucleic acid-binding Zn ribbon protein